MTGGDVRRSKVPSPETPEFGAFVEDAPDIVFRHDLAGRLLAVSRSVEEITGYSRDELLRMDLSRLVATDGLDLVREAVGDLSRDGRVIYEVEVIARDGRRIPLEVSARLVSTGGRPAAVEGIARDITERRRREARLRHRALHDPLTGAANRALFEDRIARALAAARRSEGQAALLILDLDGFKRINDRFGHSAGDAVLKEVVRRLAATVREVDTVARLGGDEFAVVLPDADAAGALRASDRIRAALREPVSIGCSLVTISASIGSARYPHDAADPDGLCERADAVMYSMKRGQRGPRAPWRSRVVRRSWIAAAALILVSAPALLAGVSGPTAGEVPSMAPLRAAAAQARAAAQDAERDLQVLRKTLGDIDDTLAVLAPELSTAPGMQRRLKALQRRLLGLLESAPPEVAAEIRRLLALIARMIELDAPETPAEPASAEPSPPPASTPGTPSAPPIATTTPVLPATPAP